MAEQETPDPFAQLADWADKTERRVRIGRGWNGLARKLPWVLTGLLVTGLVAVAAPRMLSAWQDGGATGAYPKASVPSGITVTSTQSAAPTDPFTGTPAATYPKGAAGITLPKAAAVTGFTAAQVDADLKAVRRAMIAGRLDATMLTGHGQGRLIAMLAPSQRADVTKWFFDASFMGVATWIDPAVKLDPREQPRVSGRVTYSSVISRGVRTLRVTTNFIWVYAFVFPVEHPLAAVHDEVNWEFPVAANLQPADRGMWVGPTKVYSAWVDCAAAHRGLIAPGRPAATPQPSDTEDPMALLKADHTLDITDGC
ncbi:hypothetical protein ODJ79_12055 [Actinoplanes sp. KI2]|uniref:hypothetical protein n=1 Tax=Actinoplanes sp. KI2 TaxID=2983315 RepID=UPI0021D59E64|nr:hypothetical protein [Actinoplanes sp. KI2]MCU7724451.1 hypothetical protein [Actinoplanes sp. KI2]